MSDEISWPREIFMREREDHDQAVVTAVLSEHATVARWEGDEERDAEFHRYVDADIHDSSARYWQAMVAAAYEVAAKRISDEADDDMMEGHMSPEDHAVVTSCSEIIRALTPDDAKAALEQVRRDAFRSGMERASEIAHECNDLRTKSAISAEIRKGNDHA